MKDMKDFDIAKYLREHQLGSYGILNHYVDIKPLKEESMNDGLGGEYEQAETVSEDADLEEFSPHLPMDTSKFIGTLPRSIQAQSSVDKVLDAIKTAGITTDELMAFVDAVRKGDLPLEEDGGYSDQELYQMWQDEQDKGHTQESFEEWRRRHGI